MDDSHALDAPPSQAQDPTPEHRDSQYYFAYGGSMHLTASARRWPESKLFGTASLPGHRWQINQRGYANIVPSPDDTVEGVVYEISAKDEVKLHDYYTGSKHYEKAEMKVIAQRHPLYEGQLSRVLAESRDLVTNRPTVQNNSSTGETSNTSDAETEPVTVEALVYISYIDIYDGEVHPKYAAKMNDAARDAVMLGVSYAWINKRMGKFLHQQTTLLDQQVVNHAIAEEVKCEDDDHEPSPDNDPILSDFIVVNNIKKPKIELPAGVLKVIRDMKYSCSSRSPPKVYLVELEQGHQSSQPTIVDATTDPKLANELIVKHFLEAANKGADGILEENRRGSDEWRTSLQDEILVLLQLRTKDDVVESSITCRMKIYTLSEGV